MEWKALLSSWLHSAAQDSQPAFSGQIKSSQTLACSLLSEWEGMSMCAGGIAPYQNFLSWLLLNVDERALLRAQGLHLCWEIQHAKTSLLLGVGGTARPVSSQMFFLQNRAVKHIPTV